MGAIRDTVYNNYLTAYAPKELTRFDSHKKSELRSVYNSIVKLNKESPWHLPIASKETKDYAVNLKEQARSLHNVLASLGALEEDGLFSKKSAYSSNDSVLEVSFVGDAGADEEIPEYTITVENLANGQENLGNFLDNKRVGLRADSYSFDLNINDRSYEFQFAIGEEDTNPEIQNRLARLVNNANVGIRASVVEREGKSALKLSSEATGIPRSAEQSSETPVLFTVSDEATSMRKGAVAYFGLNLMSEEPRDARFTLDGQEHSSHSNHFRISGRYDISLKSVTAPEESVTIGLKTDLESLADNVSGMVSGYNDFMKAVDSYKSSQRLSGHLASEMKGISSYYSEDMEKMGLTMDSEGRMQLDRSLLKEYAGSVQDVALQLGELKSYAKALLKKTDQVALNPMEYVDKKIVAYKNPGHNFASPYISSAYSGMMFNYYC